MSNQETEPIDVGPTKPEAEHALLQRFVGEWKLTTKMMMPDGSEMESSGTESVTSFGGLFAYFHGVGSMGEGEQMEYYCAIGFDVTFREYRGMWIANMSSHIWSYKGELSEDGNVLTLNCVGPNMDPSTDALTANYRDVHEFIDDNTRTQTSYGEMPDGSWVEFMKTTATRA